MLLLQQRIGWGGNGEVCESNTFCVGFLTFFNTLANGSSVKKTDFFAIKKKI